MPSEKLRRRPGELHGRRAAVHRGDRRWDGDTLVVETTNFLRAPNVPHDDLRVIERFRRLDASTLFYEFTVEDSDYTAPYTG